jgi:hypothetical protein
MLNINGYVRADQPGEQRNTHSRDSAHRAVAHIDGLPGAAVSGPQ